jgi:hypothetical protein
VSTPSKQDSAVALSPSPPAAVPPAAVPPPRRRWYGWQTVIIDGIAIAVAAPIAAGACNVTTRHYEDGGPTLVTRNEEPRCADVVLGAGVLAILGTPIVHAAHGRWGGGWWNVRRASGDAGPRGGAQCPGQ